MTPPPEKLAGSLDALRSLQSAASLPCAPRISRGRIASGSSGTGSCCGSSGAGTQSRHSLAARDVDLDEFRACCRDLVDRVVRRLLVLGIEGTFLQEECGGVQAADDDEAVFCKAAAGLGLDPYALDDKGRDSAMRLHEALGLAVEFGVSAMLIAHQLQNHGIAGIR